MDIAFKNVIRSFDHELNDCKTKECAVLFLTSQATSSMKKSKYDLGNAILDHTRQKFMKREAQELSLIEKYNLLKMQLQKSIMFMCQNNKGGTKLMVSVAENMANKLGKYSEVVKKLKSLSESENIHEMILHVVKDDRFDLNNITLTINMLIEIEVLLHQASSASSSQIIKSPEFAIALKPYSSN